MLFEWYFISFSVAKGWFCSGTRKILLTCSQNVWSSRKQSSTWPDRHTTSHALLLLLHELFIRASCFTSDGITVIVSHTCQRRLICKPTCFDSSDPMSWQSNNSVYWPAVSTDRTRTLVHLNPKTSLRNSTHKICSAKYIKVMLLSSAAQEGEKKITWNVQFQVLGVVSLEMPVENFQILTSWTQVH